MGAREVATPWKSFPLFLQDRVTTERAALSFALWMPPEEMTTMTGTWHYLRYLKSYSGVVGWQGLLPSGWLLFRFCQPSPFCSHPGCGSHGPYNTLRLPRPPCNLTSVFRAVRSPLPSLQPLIKVTPSSSSPFLGLLPAHGSGPCCR